jgi:hypothetical protein
MTTRTFGPAGLAGMLTVAALATVAPEQARSQGESGEKIFDRAVKSTVWVIVPRPDGKVESGTGSLIDRAHRLVITNFHVVGRAGESPKGDSVYVFFPHYANGELISDRTYYTRLLARGRTIHGTVKYRDDKRDLALIELDQVPSGAQSLKLAAHSVKAGQTVHSIGNPGKSGALWVYTQGVVRTTPYHKIWGARDGNTTYRFEAKVIETQSPTNPGDSGGPLVNKDGELVAVTQGYNTNAQLLSLFVDISEVKHFLNQHKLRISPAMARETQRAEKPGIEKSGDQPAAPDAKAEKDATLKLGLAKALADAGKTEKAKESCMRIIKDYPKTEAATEAKVLLDKLEK